MKELNENVPSPNRFSELTREDDVKETANVEQYDENPTNNPTRTTTKDPYVSEVDLNLNNCNRPNKIENSQTYLITTNYCRKQKESYMYERKKVALGR